VPQADCRDRNRLKTVAKDKKREATTRSTDLEVNGEYKIDDICIKRQFSERWHTRTCWRWNGKTPASMIGNPVDNRSRIFFIPVVWCFCCLNVWYMSDFKFTCWLHSSCEINNGGRISRPQRVHYSIVRTVSWKCSKTLSFSSLALLQSFHLLAHHLQTNLCASLSLQGTYPTTSSRFFALVCHYKKRTQPPQVGSTQTKSCMTNWFSSLELVLNRIFQPPSPRVTSVMPVHISPVYFSTSAKRQHSAFRHKFYHFTTNSPITSAQ
jgi:hypothetical protein